MAQRLPGRLGLLVAACVLAFAAASHGPGLSPAAGAGLLALAAFAGLVAHRLTARLCHAGPCPAEAGQPLHRLAQAVERSPSMLLITGPDGRIEYASPSFCRCAGRVADELAGTRPELLDRAGQPIDYRPEQAGALAAQREWKRECQLQRAPLSPLWVGISVSRLEAAGTDPTHISHCLWVIEEVAVQRQSLDTLREAKRLAEEAAEAKTRFLANISHEIRTPLNAILGLAKLSLDAGPAPGQRDYLEKIQAAAGSLMGLVDDILDCTRIEAGQLGIGATPFSPGEVLARIIATIAPRAREKGLAFHATVPPGLPQLVGDPLRLGQVLAKLLGNAVKFTAQGEIRLEVETRPADAGRLALCFTVDDTGIGMDTRQSAGLFEAFAQGDSSMTRRFGGAGLGLPISRHLVEQMGGHLDVHSAPGQGSRFRFTLGFDLAEPAPASAPPPAGPTPLAGLRILLVEDNDINQLIARGLLEQQGAAVQVADNGRLAVAMLQAGAPDAFDLVLMDLQMPEMDGLEATRHIRRDARLARLPVIAMTAHAMAGQRRQCSEAGMDDHIAKPVLPQQLAETILRHVRPRAQPGTPPASPADDSPPPPPAPAGLPRVDGLDTEGGLRRCSGNTALYLRLLGRFADSHAGALADIDAAIAEGRHADAERHAHTLHGAAANLGAEALRLAARSLETALRNGQPWADARDRMARECEALGRALASVLPPPAAPAAADMPDAAAFDEALARLVHLLATADGTAPEAFRRLRPALTAHFGLSNVTKLSDALDQYDYDQALTCLNVRKPPSSPLSTDQP